MGFFGKKLRGDKLLTDAVGMFDRASQKLDVAAEHFDIEHERNSEAQRNLEARRQAIEKAREKALKLAERFREFVN